MSKTIPAATVPKREGDYILITTPNYWGKGPGVKTAKQQLKDAGGLLNGPWRVRSVDPEAYLNEHGQIVHKTGHTPIVLCEYDPANKGLTLFEQGQRDRKNGCGIAHGPEGANFTRWFEGWTAEDERIKQANQNPTK